MRRVFLTTVMLGFGAALAQQAAAADEAAFKAAYSAAEAKNKEAGALKSQWTTTAAALKDAKAAAAAGKYDEAVDLAKHAEALAALSIAQSKEQEKDWTAADLR